MAKEAKLTKWRPKMWRPEYERAVAYSAMGVSNVRIGAMLGFTAVHVSNILNLPEAKARMGEFLAKLRENNNVDVTEMATKVTAKTLKRLETLLDDDEKFLESPFSIIDRGLKVSEHLMKRAAEPLERGVNVHVHNGAVLLGEQEDSLRTALRRSMQVKQLDAGSGIEVKKEDAA